MEAATIAALIGVMLLSAALALPGLMAYARNMSGESDTYLKMEAALKSQQERAETQARRLDTAQNELDELRRVLSEVQTEMGTLRRGLALLLAQLEEAGLKPVWTPPRALPDGKTKTELRRALREGFNLDEMRDLSLDLGVPNEAIGATSPTAYARELVSYAERRGLLKELERRIQELRP